MLMYLSASNLHHMKYIVMTLMVLASFACRQSSIESAGKLNNLFDAPSPAESKANRTALLQYLGGKAVEIESSIKEYPDSTELQTTLAFIREREKALRAEK